MWTLPSRRCIRIDLCWRWHHSLTSLSLTRLLLLLLLLMMMMMVLVLVVMIYCYHLFACSYPPSAFCWSHSHILYNNNNRYSTDMVAGRIDGRRARGASKTEVVYLDSLRASWKDNVSPTQLIRASEVRVLWHRTVANVVYTTARHPKRIRYLVLQRLLPNKFSYTRTRVSTKKRRKENDLRITRKWSSDVLRTKTVAVATSTVFGQRVFWDDS